MAQAAPKPTTNVVQFRRAPLTEQEKTAALDFAPIPDAERIDNTTAVDIARAQTPMIVVSAMVLGKTKAQVVDHARAMREAGVLDGLMEGLTTAIGSYQGIVDLLSSAHARLTIAEVCVERTAL